MTRARDVADTQDNLGGAVAPYVAGKNIVINGGFDIWQRGTSFTAGSVYSADRWYLNAVSGTTTVSRDTDVPTGLAGNYSIKQLTAAGSSFAQWSTPLETATVVPLQGRAVVLSYYMKKNATWSNNFSPNVYYSNSTDALASQTTGVTVVNVVEPIPTTSWARYYTTFTVPSDAKGLLIQFNPSVAQASGAQINFAAVQLELGNVPTPFARSGGLIGGELELCQRYYRKSYQQGTAPATATIGAGLIVSTTSATIANNDNYNSVNYSTPMRSAPTVTIYPYTTPSNTARVSNGGGTDLAAGSGTIVTSADSGFYLKNGSGGAIFPASGVIVFHYTADAEL